MRLIVLAAAAAVMLLGNLTGCGGSPVIRVDETISVTDSPEISSSPAIRVVETIGVTDSAHTSPSASIRVTEVIGVSDLPQMLSSVAIRVVETIGVTDSPQMLPPAVIRVIETIRVTDWQTLTPSQTQPPLPSPPARVTVTVASPKAGAVWRVGTSQDIAWKATGEGIAYVGIYYSIDGGKSMYAISQKESNDGIYTWKVPNTPTKTAQVRVLAYNASGMTLALGDSPLFTISAK